VSGVKLRWGILGVARINRALVGPLRSSPRAELLAVASRSRQRAEEEARRWEIPRAYGSYDELLADPEIDVVYVPLPNALHAEWTLKAARAGKHVLCEKPLATSLEDVDRIADAARAAGVVVTEAFMYRHHPQTLRVRELVAAGAVGKVRLVRGAFSFLDPALGGGSLWDVGCYPVSYARFVLGQEPLAAFGWADFGPSGVDETFAGLLRFPGGAIASFDSGFRAPFRTFVEIVGSDGVLDVPRPFKPGLETESVGLRRGDVVEKLEMPGAELYSGEVEDLTDAVLERRPPRVTLEDSRANVAALLALLRSARDGAPVRL
jgi:xylose dehydrogenase (NAD/NADP)